MLNHIHHFYLKHTPDQVNKTVNLTISRFIWFLIFETKLIMRVRDANGMNLDGTEWWRSDWMIALYTSDISGKDTNNRSIIGFSQTNTFAWTTKIHGTILENPWTIISINRFNLRFLCYLDSLCCTIWSNVRTDLWRENTTYWLSD